MEKIQRAGGAHCSAMEQQAKDLARQVAVLVNEVQRLKSGRTSAALPAADPVGPQNAQAVITTHLLDFRDVQVLLLSLQNAAATLMAHLAPGSPSTSCSCATTQAINCTLFLDLRDAHLGCPAFQSDVCMRGTDAFDDLRSQLLAIRHQVE